MRPRFGSIIHLSLFSVSVGPCTVKRQQKLNFQQFKRNIFQPNVNKTNRNSTKKQHWVGVCKCVCKCVYVRVLVQGRSQSKSLPISPPEHSKVCQEIDFFPQTDKDRIQLHPSQNSNKNNKNKAKDAEKQTLTQPPSPWVIWCPAESPECRKTTSIFPWAADYHLAEINPSSLFGDNEI